MAEAKGKTEVTPEWERLLKSAASFGVSAFDAGDRGDKAVQLLHAGTALEHLAKAFLSQINPALVRESRKDKSEFDILLHAVGKGVHAEPLGPMRTVSLTVALKRSSRLLASLKPLEDDLGPVINMRNGVAHIGTPGNADEQKAITAFIRAVGVLLAGLDTKESDFWGAYTDAARTRLQESATAAKVRAQEAIAAARRRYASHYGKLTDDQLRPIVEAFVAGYNPAGYNQQLVGCPSCENPALVEGWVKVEWVPDEEYDRNAGVAWVTAVYPEVEFYPASLECRTCRLELSGDDEMEAAGIEAWLLEDIEPSDFVDDEDYEEY